MSTAFHLHPALPNWMIVPAALLLLAGVYLSARVLIRKQVPRRWVVILSSLRVAAVVIFVAGLLQPVLSYVRSTYPKPAIAVVIDTSASMALEDGDAARLKQATNLLRDGPFADHLRNQFTIHWYEAGPDASLIDPKDLDRLQARGETTKLADALRGASEQSRARGAGVRRVLLVSDGADHGAADLSAEATRLGIPVERRAGRLGGLGR